MSKKRQHVRQRIAAILMSVFVLLVAFVPIFLTARWVFDVMNVGDPRKVVAVSFTPRPFDKSTPLRLFQQPIISVSFDDGWESVYTRALPILDKDGIHTTQYIITDTFGNYSYMSVAQLHSMQQAGHEIGSHTVTHPDLTTLDDSSLTYELTHSKQVLSQEFGPVKDFTSPYGAYNAHTLHMISLYYRSQKNAEGDPAISGPESINTKATFNPMNFISFSVRNTTTLGDIQKLIQETRDSDGWLVLTYHQVDYSGEAFSVTPQAFQRQIDSISASPVRIATVGQVMDEALSTQKAQAQP